MRKGFLAAGGLMLFALVFLLVFNAVGADSVPEAKKLFSTNGQVEVPAERLPTTFPERLLAAPITLLPNRAAVKPLSVDASQYQGSIERFLSVWETFSPRARAARLAKDGVDTYQRPLQNLVSSQTLSQIVARSDNSGAAGICPETDCADGQIWVPASFGQARLLAADANMAYVTGYGAVTIHSDDPASWRDGRSYYRAYGLILERDDSDRWLVRRVVAETVSEL